MLNKIWFRGVVVTLFLAGAALAEVGPKAPLEWREKLSRLRKLAPKDLVGVEVLISRDGKTRKVEAKDLESEATKTFFEAETIAKSVREKKNRPNPEPPQNFDTLFGEITFHRALLGYGMPLDNPARQKALTAYFEMFVDELYAENPGLFPESGERGGQPKTKLAKVGRIFEGLVETRFPAKK